MTRRRQEKSTRPIEHRPMAELVAEYFAQLNSASEGALWAPSSTDRGNSVGHLSTAALAEVHSDDGRRAVNLSTATQGE